MREERKGEFRPKLHFASAHFAQLTSKALLELAVRMSNHRKAQDAQPSRLNAYGRFLVESSRILRLNQSTLCRLASSVEIPAGPVLPLEIIHDIITVSASVSIYSRQRTLLPLCHINSDVSRFAQRLRFTHPAVAGASKIPRFLESLRTNSQRPNRLVRRS